MKVKVKFKYVLWTLVALVLLYFSFRDMNWKDFVAVLRECRWGFVVLSMVFGAIANVVRGLRWRLLILPLDPEVKRGRCIDGFIIARMADYVIPHSCEFIRCGFVTSPRLRYDKAIGTVLLERTWDIFILFLLIIAVLAMRWDLFGTFFSEKILGPVAGNAPFNLWWVVLAVVAILVAVYAFVPGVRKSFKGIGQGLISFTKMKNKGLFMIYTLILWTCFVLMTMTIIWSLPGDFGLDLVDGLFIMAVGGIASIVPVPGGFGAFHYLVALALQSIFDIPFETGIIFATLSHESQTLMLMITGAIAYAYEALKRPDQKVSVEQVRQDSGRNL